MKLAFNEVWNFVDLVRDQDVEWKFNLHTNGLIIREIDVSVLEALRKDEHYDPEILPSIFTFREIMWQPNVFERSSLCLPGLRILKAYCDETATYLKNSNTGTVTEIYRKLIMCIGGHCASTIKLFEKSEDHEISRILGDFRTRTFPIIKFFIYHPGNRTDYHKDAVKRLDYAVKVILNDYQGRYTTLEEPYWVVSCPGTSGPQKKAADIKPKQS